MNVFDGLYGYEVILLVLGVVFFVALIVAFLVQIMRTQQYGKLLPFFALPIIMIGYPGIEKIKVTGSGVEIEKKYHDLQRDPTNEEARQELADAVEKVADRPISNPRLNAIIAQAQFALGDDVAASERVDKVLRENPRQPTALALRRHINLDRRLGDLTVRAEQNPNDTSATSRLQSTVSEIKQFQLVNPQTMVKIADAERILGNESQAKAYVDTALQINPNLPSAIQLNSRLGNVTPVPVPDTR
jgi:tetratricopeptide (TPR) repeat protein